MLNLMKALDTGDLEFVKKILDSNPDDFSMRDGEDRVALHYAAEVADPETFRRIMELDLSLIDCQDQNGNTPLLIASMSGNVAAIKMLVEKGANINHLDKDKHSSVHWAVVCGQLDALVVLIGANAYINVLDIQGAQPLHYATVAENVPLETSTAILHVLIKNGANINATDFDGRTPLLWAACNGNVEAIISLLQAGANHKIVDRNQLNVLHCAASQGHENALKLLIQTSDPALINGVDRNGDTPLFYAVTLGHFECARLLLINEANPNHQNFRLKTASHYAAAKGQLRLLKVLKHYGASMETQNLRGDIPLHEAIQAGSKEIVEWLLTMQPSTIDAINHCGRSGLHLAAAAGNMEIVILLCSKNIEINPLMLSNNQLYTPLDLAEIKDHEVVADYLRRRHKGNKAEQLSDEERQEWITYLTEQINRAKKTAGRRTIIELEYNQVSGSTTLIQRRHSFENIKHDTQEIQTDDIVGPLSSVNETQKSRNQLIETVVVDEPPEPKSTSTTDLNQPNSDVAEILNEEKSDEIMVLEQTSENGNKKQECTIVIAERQSEDMPPKPAETTEVIDKQNENNTEVLKKTEELKPELLDIQNTATCYVEDETEKIDEKNLENVDVAQEESKRADSAKSDVPGHEIDEVFIKTGKNGKEDGDAEKKTSRRTTSNSNKKTMKQKKTRSSSSKRTANDSDVTDVGIKIHEPNVGTYEEQPTSSTKSATKPVIVTHTMSLQTNDTKFFYDYSSGEASDENVVVNDDKTVRKQKTRSVSSSRRSGVLDDKSEKQRSDVTQKSKNKVSLQEHETAIFQELTNLKKTQIQHGKDHEQGAVQKLINRFCKKHSLDPARFKVYTYNDWEKFLHEQLKLLYAEERQQLLRSRRSTSSRSTGR